MLVKRVRPGSTFHALIAVFTLALLCSSQAASAGDPKQELIDALKGENVEGFLFALDENDTHVVTSLTNPDVHEEITLGSSDPGLVLRYTSLKEKATGATNLYKAEVVNEGTSLSFVLTDLATQQPVDFQQFPAPAGGCPPPVFEDVSACLREFDCSQRGGFQCEANRTCQAQIVGVTCCLKDGNGVSVHLIIPPTSIRCALQNLTSGLEGLVLTQD